MTETFNPAFLREAIRLSVDSVERQNGGPFGAVIVRDGEVLARGWNRGTSTNDPTAHAEVVAIREVCSTLQTFSLSGCEIYSSCEPCPLCLAAIYWSRLERIYYGASCEDAAAAGFDDTRLYHELAKHPDQRWIPMKQMLREQAVPAFQAWCDKDNRVEY